MYRLALVLLLCALICPASADQVPPPSISCRIVGSQSNLPPPTMPVVIMGAIGDSFVGASADSTQAMHFPAGSYVASFTDFGEASPVIAGPIPATQDAWTTFDLPVDWLYEADNRVIGQPFADVGQTFKATSDELAKVAFFVTSAEDDFDVTIRKAGPDGDVIGPAKLVKVGSGWGIARWQPGDVPLTVGETYYVGIKSKSGRPFTIGLHSSGDIYPAGNAFFDGAAEPISDLGLLISLQRSDSVRSQLMFANNDGWVLHSRGVYFRARSANLRAAFAKVKVKNAPESIQCTLKLSRVNANGSLTAIGGSKTCQSAGKTADGYIVGALWGWDELPLQPPGVYFLEIEPRWDGLDGPAPKADYLVSLYGEKTPGANPVIYNQRVTQVTSTSVRIAWEGTGNSIVRVHYGLTPDKLVMAPIAVPKGATEVDIRPIAPGTTFCFKIVAQSELGGKFETPVYVTRSLDAANNPVKDPPLPPIPNENFVPLARMDRLTQPPLPEVHEIAEISIENAEFKDKAGWQIDKASSETLFTQQVAVTKGSLYMLEASISTGTNGVQVRLVCDPSGASQFSGANSSQNFRTGGKQMQFAELWQAESDSITVGLAVSGLSDPANIADVAKRIRLVEVKEKKPSFWKRWGRKSPP